MNFLSIKDIAQRLNVSKVTIYSKLKSKEVSKYVFKKDGKTYISDEGLEAIRDTLKSYIEPKNDLNFEEIEKTVTIENNLNKDEFLSLKDELINTLQKENEYLKSQILNKDEQLKKKDEFLEAQADKNNKLLENMQILLKQSQEIALLSSPKSENDIEAQEGNKMSLWGKFKGLFK